MKNLLAVILYPSTFVKMPLKYLAKHSDNIYVIIPMYLSRTIVDKYYRFNDYSDGNIYYFYPRIFYIPIKKF